MSTAPSEPHSLQFCAFTPSAERCKKALAHDNPELYAKIYGSSTESASRDQNPPASISTSEAVGEALASEVDEKLHIAGDSAPPPVVAEATEDTDKKHQSRGGRGLQRDESAKLDKEAQKRAVRRLNPPYTTPHASSSCRRPDCKSNGLIATGARPSHTFTDSSSLDWISKRSPRRWLESMRAAVQSSRTIMEERRWTCRATLLMTCSASSLASFPKSKPTRLMY